MTAPVQARHPAGTGAWWTAAARACFAIVVLAYFVHFVGPSLWGGFNLDDPGNIYHHWSRAPGKLLLNLPLFFTSYSRPMGGVYFVTLYWLFGLNPLPYHAVMIALLLFNTFLAYRFARLITGSELAGGLTALMTAYHVDMLEIVYLPAYIFDVLSFMFYFLALNYYVAIRMRGERLSRRQLVFFLLLYVGALESKEMAVTLPAIVLLYEAIMHRPEKVNMTSVAAWLRGDALPALIAGTVTALYILGKTFGSGSLLWSEAYRPVFTWDRYWESTVRFVNNLFYQPIDGHGFFNPGRVVLLAAILLYVALRRRKKSLLLMWLFIWITPLPITFVPGRFGGMLYIVLAGWALIIATFFVSLCDAAYGLFAPRRLPAIFAKTAVVVLGVAAFWGYTSHKDRFTSMAMEAAFAPMRNAIEQVRAVQPQVPAGSKVCVLADMWDSWDTKFVMELVWGDRSVNVWLTPKTPLTPAEIEGMDYVFTYESGKWKRLRGK